MSKANTPKTEPTASVPNPAAIDWSTVRAAPAQPLTIAKLHTAWRQADERRHYLGCQLAWELANHFPTEILTHAAEVAQQDDARLEAAHAAA